VLRLHICRRPCHIRIFEAQIKFVAVTRQIELNPKAKWVKCSLSVGHCEALCGQSILGDMNIFVELSALENVNLERVMKFISSHCMLVFLRITTFKRL
jgi:hypothetical protein